MQINVKTVESEKLDTVDDDVKSTVFVTLSGPLYFGTSTKIEKLMDHLDDHKHVIFDLSGVNVADLSGIEAFKEKCEELMKSECEVFIVGISSDVKKMFDRCGFIDKVENELYFENGDLVFDFIASK